MFFLSDGIGMESAARFLILQRVYILMESKRKNFVLIITG